MRKRNLRLPDAAAGKSAIASSHNDEVSMPSSSTNPTTGVAGIQTAPARRASEKAKATRIRKKVQQLGRNLSSPARLIKLNALLSDDQKKLVIQWTWGGMLQVKGKSMPVDLSMWLLGCFDPVRSELVIPGRGTIVVDAESYHRNFGLLNEGDPVPFELDPEAIAFMNEEYAIPNGMAPTFAAWCKMIKEMNGVADMKFLRAYIGGVISCFVCPTTKHSITPRCYGAISNLEKARASNFCQLAIDQIRKEVKNMGVKKNSVCCCLYHFVVLYLDSLEVDEPVEPESVCPVRAAAWTDQLIQAVMQKDRKPDGTFGKLRFKEGAGVTIRDSLFVGMAQTELFVSSKLPATFSVEKKRKLSLLVGDLCTDISRRLGTFVEDFGALNQDESTSTHAENMTSKRRRTGGDNEVDENEEESDYDEEQDEDDEDEEQDNDEDQEQDDEEDGGNGDGDGADGQDDDNDDHQGDATCGGSSSQNTHTSGDRNREGGEKDAALVHPIRRSARLAKNSPSKKQLSEGNSNGLSEHTSRSGVDEAEDITLFCLMRYATRSMQKEQPSEASPMKQSPFSELKAYVAERGPDSPPIDMPVLEAPEFFDTPPRHYAKRVFMETIDRNMQPPPTSPMLDKFRKDFAVQEVMAECFQMEKEKLHADNFCHVRKKQKTVAHRGKPTASTPPTIHEEGFIAHVPVHGVTNAAVSGGSQLLASSMPSKPAPNTIIMPSDHENTGQQLVSPLAATKPTEAATKHCETATKAVPTKRAPSGTQMSEKVAEAKNPSSMEIDTATEHKPAAIRSTSVGPSRNTCPPPSTKTVAGSDTTFPTPFHCVTPASNPDVPRFDRGSTCSPKIQRSTRMRGEGYADAPSFSLGFGSPENTETDEQVESELQSAIKPVDLAPRYDDDEWVQEAVALCVQAEEEKEKKMKKLTSTHPHATSETQARTVRRPPYVDYGNKITFNVSAEVNKVYASVVAHGRRSTRGQNKENTTVLVNYDNFFASVQELANSMMPGGSLKNSVVELGIESIMQRTEKRMKKVVMPLRFSTIILQNMNWRDKELIKHFAKQNAHLDRKDLVVLPVMENLAPQAPEPVNHYWLLNINIKERRFECMDSMRSKADKRLDQFAKKLITTLICMWEEQYKDSPIQLDTFSYVDIEPPKQTTLHDCGVCALYNAEAWNGTSLAAYEGQDCTSIRKLMTHTWVTSVMNDVKWMDVLAVK